MKTFREKIDKVRNEAVEFIKTAVKTRGEVVLWDGDDMNNDLPYSMGLAILYLDKHQWSVYYYPTKILDNGDVEAQTMETGDEYTFTLEELQTEEICKIADHVKTLFIRRDWIKK